MPQIAAGPPLTKHLARYRAVALAFLLVSGTPEATRATDHDSPAPPPLEQVEELTESFANALLDLSLAVRAKEPERMGSYFAPQVWGIPFPEQAGELRDEAKWIRHHDWGLESNARLIAREEWVRSMECFLAHLAQVEDARFKVKASTVHAESGCVEGDIALWLVARDGENRREWVRGRGQASGRRTDDGTWQLTRFVLEHLESMVCVRDLFDEVSVPAGVAAAAPAFLERRDPRFAAYGAAVADVNADGLVDVFVTGGGENFLYLNRGDGTFADESDAVFVKHLLGTGIGPLFLDYDNDGDEDLFVSTVGQQVLFENRLVPGGKLDFLDVSESAGVARNAIGFSAVAGDVNADGYPDIYVACYNRYGEILPDRWDGASNGTPNLLFVSQGDGTYREAAAEWGVDDGRWGYAAQFADIDGDADLDLYGTNDFGGGNVLYLNEGSRFRDVADERGVVDRGYGMGVSFGDYDNDGDLDLHVTRMSSTAGRRILGRLTAQQLPEKDELENLALGNALYENTGAGWYREVGASAGPFPAGWAWGGGFIDLDNDGWQDLYTPNGFISGTSLKDT